MYVRIIIYLPASGFSVTTERKQLFISLRGVHVLYTLGYIMIFISIRRIAEKQCNFGR